MSSTIGEPNGDSEESDSKPVDSQSDDKSKDTWVLSPEELFNYMAEFDQPRKGWELLVEIQGAKVFRRPHNCTDLFEYRLLGNLKTISPDVFFQVYMDLEYRKTWDVYVKDLYEVEVSGQKAIYWELKYPFPLANRDYIYLRKFKTVEYNGQKVYIVNASSIPSDIVRKRANVIRVSHYRQTVIIARCAESGTLAYMEYFDNPGGMIPASVVNKSARVGVTEFLTTMQKACEGYENYKRKKKAQTL